jgi:hypothetical protein
MLIGKFNVESEYLSGLLVQVENTETYGIPLYNFHVVLREDSFSILRDGRVTEKFKYGDEHKIRIIIEAARHDICLPRGLKLSIGGYKVRLGGMNIYRTLDPGRILMIHNSLWCFLVTRDYLYHAENVESYIEKVRRVITVMLGDSHYIKNGETFDMLMIVKSVKGAHKC